jgi:CBS domain containing-hemolysin-like protein
MHGNARFEVVDMDGNRIDKVLIEVGPKSHREAPEAVTHD